MDKTDNKDKKDNNIRFWEKAARFYSPIQERSNKQLYNKTVRRCQKYINGTKSVLELACGTGQFTFDLCGGALSWEATDFSEAMIAEAESRQESKAHFSVQDATGLEYDDESFDVVLIANALHIMPEPELALSEIHRVLRSGGILIAPTFVYDGRVNHLRMWVMRRFGFRTFSKWTLEGLTAFLKSGGFQLVECSIIEGDPLPEGFAVLRKI